MTPKQKFSMQKTSAVKRGIGWHLTFDEWMEIRQESGKLAQRGREKGCFVMGRIGDCGPYSKNNVQIIPVETNHADAFRNGTGKGGSVHAGTGKGWTKNGNEVTTTAAAELYDPSSDTWESLPDMPTARGSAGAAVIGDTCFVIGGFRWSPPLAFAVTEGLSTRWRIYFPSKAQEARTAGA